MFVWFGFLFLFFILQFKPSALVFKQDVCCFLLICEKSLTTNCLLDTGSPRPSNPVRLSWTIIEFILHDHQICKWNCMVISSKKKTLDDEFNSENGVSNFAFGEGIKEKK